MSVLPSDIVVYGSANMPEAEGAINGGPVDFSRRVAFYDIAPAGNLDVISSSASDTSVSPQTAIQVRSPMDGSLQTRTGAFSVGLIGGMPASAAGGNYVLEATANLSDGRVLKLNSTVQCKLPGP
jgi:hypothetical protein